MSATAVRARQEEARRRAAAVSHDDVIYTAGLFDGEGSVCLQVKHTQRSSAGLPKRAPLLLVQLSLTDEATIRWLGETWGGSLFIGHRLHSQQPHHRIVHSWRLHSAAAQIFLETVLPFLRVKRRQAELGIRSRRDCAPNRKLGPTAMLGRLALRDELVALNGRQGSSAAPHGTWKADHTGCYENPDGSHVRGCAQHEAQHPAQWCETLARAKECYD
jgi:hypothetical protein